MDAIVTARVPVAVKEQVGSILRDIGSTPSQLVNAAYEYVLAEHKTASHQRWARGRGIGLASFVCGTAAAHSCGA